MVWSMIGYVSKSPILRVVLLSAVLSGLGCLVICIQKNKHYLMKVRAFEKINKVLHSHKWARRLERAFS